MKSPTITTTPSSSTIATALLLLGFGVNIAAGLGVSATCSNPKTSCMNTTVVEDLCCFNAPGGSFLQTQFWDTDPSTGPTNSWTIHGLWPDHCDGTFDESCDETRAYKNITQILEGFGKTELLSFMQTYWKNDPDDGTDEEFWEHEWETHGTCMSTLKTSCYTDYTPTQEAVDFFQTVVDLFKTLDTYSFLEAADITPSSSKTYTSSAILAALKAGFGETVVIQCDGSALNAVYYFFDVTGSVQDGTFVPTTPVGDTSDCPSSGVKYSTKTGTAVSTTTATTKTSTSTKTATTTSTAPTSTGTSGTFSGSGFLNAIVSGSEEGCLISAGTWFTTGTCATYHATASGSTFTMTSSKGNCGVVDGEFTCGSGVSLSSFTAIGGLLAYEGSTAFSADAVPTGSTQEAVSTGSGSVDVTFEWEST